MKAMILAAGLGTRLLPFTLMKPKPLFPVLNIPLVHLTISRIRKSGFTTIIINAHHLRHQIKEALQHEANCILQEEETILGTGGGLRKAMPHFDDKPLLVVNGDIYHTINYQDVYSEHCASKADVTLVLHDYPRFNNVAVDERLMITGFKKTDNACGQKGKLLAFTGIHVINPKILQNIPPETPCCIVECYEKILAQGGTIRARLVEDHYWTDMGTPEDYLQLHADLLKQKIPVYEELDKMILDAPFTGLKNASISDAAKLIDWACIGKGAVIGDDVTIKRSVVWDDAVIPAGCIIQDAIVTD
ncbi:MAG: NTP transferase domain-containing protein [Deltaproteobacteria bacterium]|jgi:mannose-1-phosphate guanylyltransferase|nr:NTP transferase domain-containing protein [Deltaproteobacteria bacterium]